MEKQRIIHQKYYPDIMNQIVYAPQWYFPKDVKKDDYSCKIVFSKTEDKTSIYLPKILELLKYLRSKKIIENIDFVVVMPSHIKGIFSVTLSALAPIIAKEFNAQHENILERIISSEKKSTDCKTLEDRYALEKNSMKVKEGITLNGKKILLLDDVKTTGIAILEACKILSKKGVDKIIPICLGINNSYVEERWGG